MLYLTHYKVIHYLYPPHNTKNYEGKNQFDSVYLGLVYWASQPSAVRKFMKTEIASRYSYKTQSEFYKIELLAPYLILNGRILFY